MAQDGQGGNFWGSLPGVLTGMATLLTAAAGTYALVRGSGGGEARPATAQPVAQAEPAPTSPGCRSGFVWRQARRDDRVCVPPARREAIVEENALALERREPGGGPSGENTCRQGYVWRNTSDQDYVCVGPESREQAWRENDLAPERATP